MIIRDLGDGLVVRRATPADVEAIVRLNSEVHYDLPGRTPNPRIAAWTRDLAAGRLPGFGVDGFCLVEDTRRGAVVSSLCLIPQT